MAKLIRPSDKHFIINGAHLAFARDKLGLSQAEFAERCGWSQQFQSQLEYPEDKEITAEKAEMLKKALSARGGG